MRRKVISSETSISTRWLTLDSPQTALPSHRLLVLLPDGDLNEAGLAHALWRVAGQHGTQVHLIIGVDDWAGEGLVRLREALVESMLREANIEPTSEMVSGNADWVQLARQHYVPGDVVVCLAEHKLPVRTHTFGIEVSPISHHLAALRMPVCELRNVIIHQPTMTVIRAIKVWIVPLLIIFGSLALEAMFFSWARNWAEWVRNAALAIYTTVEILSVAWLARR